MKRFPAAAILAMALSLGAVPGAWALDVYQGVESGYYGDVAGILRFSLRGLSQRVPVELRLMAGAAYQFDSGDATLARKIFINDNTGGTIEKYGTNLLVGLDLAYRLLGGPDLALNAFAGPRGSFYSAHYTFVGNNESFAVRSNAAGIGGGASVVLRMGKRTVGTLTAGVDYFFPAKLYGHGTYTYTPDGVDQNPRNDYTYEDADAAVNQPRLLPALTLGVEYLLK
jgi:hypothetical protein